MKVKAWHRLVRSPSQALRNLTCTETPHGRQLLQLRCTWARLTLLPVIDCLTRNTYQLSVTRCGDSQLLAMRSQPRGAKAARYPWSIFVRFGLLCPLRTMGNAADLFLKCIHRTAQLGNGGAVRVRSFPKGFDFQANLFASNAGNFTFED